MSNNAVTLDDDTLTSQLRVRLRESMSDRGIPSVSVFFESLMKEIEIVSMFGGKAGVAGRIGVSEVDRY